MTDFNVFDLMTCLKCGIVDPPHGYTVDSVIDDLFKLPDTSMTLIQLLDDPTAKSSDIIRALLADSNVISMGLRGNVASDLDVNNKKSNADADADADIIQEEDEEEEGEEEEEEEEEEEVSSAFTVGIIGILMVMWVICMMCMMWMMWMMNKTCHQIRQNETAIYCSLINI